MVVGFQTSTWLHECDSGKVRRRPLTSGHTEWSPWGHVVFMPRMNPGDLCGPLEEMTLLGAGPDRKFEPLPFLGSGGADDRPSHYVHAGILREHKETGETKFIPAWLDPKHSAIPITMFFSENDEAVTSRIGLPIMRLLKTREELDQVVQALDRRGERRAEARQSLHTTLDRAAQLGMVLEFRAS